MLLIIKRPEKSNPNKSESFSHTVKSQKEANNFVNTSSDELDSDDEPPTTIFKLS